MLYKVISVSENLEPNLIPCFPCNGLLDVVDIYPKYILLKDELGFIVDFGKILKHHLLDLEKQLAIVRSIFFMNRIAIFNDSYEYLQEATPNKLITNYRDALSNRKLHANIFIDYNENLLGVGMYLFERMKKVKLTDLSSVKEVPNLKKYYKGLQVGTPLMDSIRFKLCKTRYEILRMKPYTFEARSFYERYLNLRKISFSTESSSYNDEIFVHLR